MKIHVLYFAGLREAIGLNGEDIDVPDTVVNVGTLRAYLIGRGEPWASAFANLKRQRAAVNQVMAFDETPLEENAEVAFFPPVTGG